LSKPETPQPPDYIGAAGAQGDANIEAALAGTALATPNQTNPFGSTTWSNTSYDKAMADWLAGKPAGGPASGTGYTTPGFDPSMSDYTLFGGDAGGIPADLAAGFFTGGLGTLNAPGGSVNAAIGSNFNLPTPGDIFGGGDDHQGPQYVPSEQERAYMQWLAARPDQSNYNRPGDWSLKTEFSPELQALFDRTANDPLAPADLGAGVEANRNEAEDAVYRRATRYLDPQTQQQREVFRAQLADQGILPGSEAYTYQMDQFEKNIGTSYADARDRAIMMGGAEADRSFAQNIQTYLQRLRERSLPFEEYKNLRGLLPSANPSAQSVQASPILQALQQQFGANLQNYGIESANYGSQMGAGAGIISAIIAALL